MAGALSRVECRQSVLGYPLDVLVFVLERRGETGFGGRRPRSDGIKSLNRVKADIRILVAHLGGEFEDRGIFREMNGECAQRSGKPAQLIDGEMTSWYGARAIAGMRYLAQLRGAASGSDT